MQDALRQEYRQVAAQMGMLKKSYTVHAVNVCVCMCVYMYVCVLDSKVGSGSTATEGNLGSPLLQCRGSSCSGERFSRNYSKTTTAYSVGHVLGECSAPIDHQRALCTHQACQPNRTRRHTTLTHMHTHTHTHTHTQKDSNIKH